MSIMKQVTRLKLIKNSFNSEGFSLLELMIASTAGVALILAVNHFITQPQIMIEDLEKNLDSDALIQYNFGQMAGFIEKSQVMRTGAINCSTNTSLYSKKAAPATPIDIVLLKNSGESYSFVTSLSNSVAFKYDADSVKVANMKTDSSVNYRVGDAIVLSSVQDSSLAGLYRVKDVDECENILKLMPFSNPPSKCIPKNVTFDTLFSTGSELNPYRIDKVLFVDYVVASINNKKELHKILWPNKGNEVAQKSTAMTNFEELKIAEDVGLPPAMTLSPEEQGLGYLRVVLDLKTNTKKTKVVSGKKIENIEESQLVAGYRFESSIRNDFSEIEAGKPNELGPPPGCALQATVLDMNQEDEGDAHRYVKIEAKVPSKNENDKDPVFFDSSSTGNFSMCWDLTETTQYNSNKRQGVGGAIQSFGFNGSTRRSYICRVNEVSDDHVKEDWVLKSNIQYFEPIEGKFKRNNCTPLIKSFALTKYKVGNEGTCTTDHNIVFPTFDYDGAAPANPNVIFKLPLISAKCHYSGSPAGTFVDCDYTNPNSLKKVKFIPDTLGKDTSNNKVELTNKEVDCAAP